MQLTLSTFPLGYLQVTVFRLGLPSSLPHHPSNVQTRHLGGSLDLYPSVMLQFLLLQQTIISLLIHSCLPSSALIYFLQSEISSRNSKIMTVFSLFKILYCLSFFVCFWFSFLKTVYFLSTLFPS